ncbi:MAG TPA: N-acetyl-gamma-glutamyl-phosphate reductase [Herpetosiphonaceae bacterium]
MVRVGIFGVTGYAGYELARWIQRHPAATVAWAVSESSAGKRLREVVPGPLDMPLLAADQADWSLVDVVFTALPHGVAARTAQAARAAGVRVIDLSADLRLDSPEAYRQWYGAEHPAPELLGAPYGLPELGRAALADAPLVANPGCYPTSVLLGLAPLARTGALLPGEPVIVNAASGVSGAGRSPKQNLHYVEANENFSPYAIGHVHRHVGEMEQELALLAGAPVTIIFSPHLLPVQRGILSTIYARISPELSLAEIRGRYEAAYAGEPFVNLLPDGTLAALSHTAHTNQCAISLTLAQPGLLIVEASIDNLLKGAAGQAIQNMNLMFGLPETQGLL